MANINMHINYNHYSPTQPSMYNQPAEYRPSESYNCDPCDEYLYSSADLDAHMTSHMYQQLLYNYSPSAAPSSDILQVDGNDSTMMDLSDLTPAPANNEDLTYNYTLNPQNQARRLFSTAQNNPYTITCNNFKIVDGLQYAHNVNV